MVAEYYRVLVRLALGMMAGYFGKPGTYKQAPIVPYIPNSLYKYLKRIHAGDGAMEVHQKWHTGSYFPNTLTLENKGNELLSDGFSI